MVRRNFPSRDIVKVLTDHNYSLVGREGSHVRLCWDPPEGHSTEGRLVSVPVGHEVGGDTLRNIADQCGAEDFDAFCAWIDRNR
ncbi:type II toxin-antitoxin system HicA family toxin [Halolamina sp. CBA1230]|uniref:type II toxin-antitoxin system HicA family toxin n=1 Tax=Halolamina sp. CBA1230 TaxID=1853690 RepID=UPI0009A1933D|nr:type II toxin-antitoxin system HicA family toxin [Halolamina sp. CBA1230]QKY20245.1 type II toxin-antitoxin system HicA family toxin [Halolamina sp. CBA1230]